MKCGDHSSGERVNSSPQTVWPHCLPSPGSLSSATLTTWYHPRDLGTSYSLCFKHLSLTHLCSQLPYLLHTLVQILLLSEGYSSNCILNYILFLSTPTSTSFSLSPALFIFLMHITCLFFFLVGTFCSVFFFFFNFFKKHQNLFVLGYSQLTTLW